ncbi:MAG: ABC transporter ATP-binding protein [Ginsengibacter sp.]
MILRIEGLSKKYGPVQALNNVSFTVPAGSVFGILGPNGSGKTTLLGTVMDIIRPSAGGFKLFDEIPEAKHRKQIGTLLETPNFYHYLSGRKNLEISAEIKGHGREHIDKVLEIVDLTSRSHSKFSTYSLGMKQRLAIGAALLGDPKVLVFDEPTNGLDPEGIAEIRALIKKLYKDGKTIIMASHLLDEVEKVCTHVAILKKGVLLTTGDVNEILASEDIVEIGAADYAKLQLVLNALKGYNSIKAENGLVQLFYAADKVDITQINNFCFSNGVILNHLQLRRKSLEAKFFELTN